MHNDRVVLDIDGVLANFEKAFCEKFGTNNRQLTSLEHRYPEIPEEVIRGFVESYKTYENLDIVETGYQIAKWCDLKGFKVHLVSSRPDWLYSTTEKWLNKNKISYECLTVGIKNKLGVISQLSPLFVVEDFLSTCASLSYLGIPSFLVDWPWNRLYNPDSKKVFRIKSFDDFIFKYEKMFAFDKYQNKSIIR